MTWHITVPFDSDDHEFCRGVQVGMLYGALSDGDLPVTALLYADNTEMALRCADAFGLEASSVEYPAEGGTDWIEVTFR